MWGYNKDQVALVVPDSTAFGSQVLVNLVTPTINQITNVIKESKINELLTSLNGFRIAWLLACRQADHSVQSKVATDQMVDLTDLNKAVKTMKKEEIDAFSSEIIHS